MNEAQVWAFKLIYVHQVLTIGTPIEGQVPVLGFGGKEFARVWGIYRRLGLGGDDLGLII